MAKTTAKYREKNATLDEGRFPIADKAHALSALKLRGHAKNKAERRKIIRRAAKFAPKAAAEALAIDKEKGLV